MKQRLKKVSKTTLILIIALSLVLLSLIGLTVAYFTDSKSYTGTLEFGNVKLKVTDSKNAEMIDGGSINFDYSRSGATKLMPGDTVTMKFSVTLQSGSEPAWYLVSVTDTNGIFENGTYYLDTTTTPNVIKESNDSNKKVGLIKVTNKVSDTHTFALEKTIPTTDESNTGGSTTVSLKICAIQQANIAECDNTNKDKSAYHLLNSKLNPVIADANLPTVTNLKNVITNWTSLTSLGFYATQNIPTGYSIDNSLTSSLDARLDSESKGLIKIYKKSTTDIVFVSEGKIYAPADCSSLFANCSKLTSLDLSNFNTANVTNMGGMFFGCSSLISLDLSRFNTSSVTEMPNVFDGCSSLTSLDVSNFNTSNVTDTSNMFAGCSSLTTIELSSFNTSNVTNMMSMFNGCSSLKTLDLSNFDMGSIEALEWIFLDCSALTSLNLSSFDVYCFMLDSRLFDNVFDTSSGNATLIIGNIEFDDSEYSNAKEFLVAALLDESVKVICNGVEIS